MRTNNEYFSTFDILKTVKKVSENISKKTINYEKNKKKLDKMMDSYKKDPEKFSKKYLIDTLDDI